MATGTRMHCLKDILSATPQIGCSCYNDMAQVAGGSHMQILVAADAVRLHAVGGAVARREGGVLPGAPEGRVDDVQGHRPLTLACAVGCGGHLDASHVLARCMQSAYR